MARQLTSLVLLFTPVLVLNALRFIVDPLGDMMSVSLYLEIGLHVGAIGVGYFLVAADLATSGGILSSIFVPAALGASAIGLVLYASADRAEEFTAYSSAESCLEEKGYEVVFFLEKYNDKI